MKRKPVGSFPIHLSHPTNCVQELVTSFVGVYLEEQPIMYYAQQNYVLRRIIHLFVIVSYHL